MDTRIMEYMVAIQEEKNLTKAANRLFITQSALNQQLKKLEQELGSALFKRENNKLKLTETGKIYLSGAKSILTIKEIAMKQIQDIKNSGSVFTIHLAFNQKFLPFFHNVIEPEFSSILPTVSLIPVAAYEDSAKIAVLQDRADMALVITTDITSPSLECLPLRREELHLVYPKHLFSDNKEELTFTQKIEKLCPLGFISAPRDSFFTFSEQYYFNRIGLHSKTLCQANSLENLRYLLNQQFSCGLFPADIITKEDCFDHIPLVPKAYYYLALVYKKNINMSDSVKELILLLLRTFDAEYSDYNILSAFQQY